jgi:SpoIID/LytB domain protein
VAFPPLTRGVRRLLVALAGVCVSLSAVVSRATPPEGPAYLLLALPSHQIIAESRRDVLATPIAPGSVMKVITLAAALEHGAADADTRVLCRRTIDVDGRALQCVHPDFHRAIDPVEALAHSCNVYFATIARRLPRSALDAMLVRIGLSPSNPRIPLVTTALGLDGVRATPRSLLDAFCRFADVGRADVHLKDETRRVLRLGLESAAKTGTAAAFAEAGYSGLAKTGTAPMPGGGYQGLVAAVVNTDLPTHAIIVVAPGSTGAQAATLATEILITHRVPRRVPTVVRPPGSSGMAESESIGSPGRSGAGGGGPDWNPEPAGAGLPTAQFVASGDTRIRVGLARRTGGYDVADVPIEEYVAQAVAGEGGDALPTAALEALAVTVRTYAAANRDRHRADGFDVCDLTHCLSLRRATTVSRVAARSTVGLILTDRGGLPADVYLSAWCGGHTERPSQVWAGAVDHAYLPAQSDPACVHDPAWTSDMTEPQLRGVLEATGLRGAIVRDLRIGSRSTSGRVRTLLVDGMQPPEVDGGAFRFAAGRILGWQTIKSTLFDVVRTGTGVRLTGKGNGHGVGLCVRGAAARARTGRSKEQILAAYFPGLLVGARSPGSSVPRSPPSMLPPQVRVVLPETDLAQLTAIRSMADRVLAEFAATLGVGAPAHIELRFHPTVEAYRRATGQPWWTSARTTGTRVDLLPLSVLTKRGTVELTLKHECVHVLTESTLAGRPLWIREGLAAVLAGESANTAHDRGAELAQDASSAKHDRDPRCPSDADLRDAASPDAWRSAYQAAAACVSRALASGRRWQDLR